ncbi:MAG: glutamyl-tRNA reductase [Deltaproteobacteria bacterium]|nr:glutamyl-tRNA reductase [Deltaproteobacteria bacterium]
MSAVVVVGMNHRSAPVALREQLAVPAEELDGAVRDLGALEGAREALLVATCNRVEAYAAGPDPDALARSLRSWLARRAGAALETYLYEHRGEGAARHLFRVCASLDSIVVGEPQILGQVKEAHAAADEAGTLGGGLGRLVTRAFQVAKRVRTETGIAAGQVSVASVAVDLARGIFGELQNRRVLVVGAGKMALGAARGLQRHGALLAVCNRSYDRALKLAQEHGGTAHPLTDLSLLVQASDVVVCSTAATRFVLTREELQAAMKSRRGRALFLIDIAVPRNVDPRAGDLDSVYLYNVDDLEKIVGEGLEGRSVATAQAEAVVTEELRLWQREQQAQGAVPTIAALRQRFRATAQAELERSLVGRLKHLGPEERRALEAMLDATMNKLLHAPTMALKAQSEGPEGGALATATRALFALDDAPEGAQGSAPPTPEARRKATG